jgi:succinyl-diaminopimelate desuccinylase
MQEEILQLSKKLMVIPSTKDSPKDIDKVLGIVKQELKGFMFKDFTNNGSKSIIFYNKPSLPSKFKFILNAHLDVVSAKPEQYSPKIVGGKLYGRGSLDMKAPAAVEILIFKKLAKQIDYPFGLQIVTDEETGGHDGTGYQVEKGVKADFVIAGEYSNLKINNKAKGPLWIKVSAKGKTSHGAYVWAGENAIQKMALFIEEMNKLYPIPKKETWCTTQNLAKIETTNETLNKVPDNCSAYFDIRRVPEEKDLVLKKIKKILPKDFELSILEDEPVQFTKEDDPSVVKLGKSIQKITGKKVEFVGFNGASDARFYNAVNTPAVCFGPTGEGLHTDNEWVDINSLNSYYEILKDFVLNLDK